MDRFIGGQKRGGGSAVGNLKSNMDRFIELLMKLKQIWIYNLKSNMDRFIVFAFDYLQ